MKSLSRVRLFATPWTVAHQAPPSMGFSRQEYWSGLPLPSPGDLPNPGTEPGPPAFQADAFTSEPPGKKTAASNAVVRGRPNPIWPVPLQEKADSERPEVQSVVAFSSCTFTLCVKLSPGRKEHVRTRRQRLQGQERGRRGDQASQPRSPLRQRSLQKGKDTVLVLEPPACGTC